MEKKHLRRGEVRACEVCGTEKYYTRTFLRRRNPRCCSRSHAAILRHREGWVATPKRKKYSKKWMAPHRATALEAYGEACSMCGFNEDVRLLDVDHKNEDPKDHRVENLQVLCVMCHAKLTRGVVPRPVRG